MTTASELLSWLAEDRHDPQAWLITADWYEEKGDLQQADWLRQAADCVRSRDVTRCSIGWLGRCDGPQCQQAYQLGLAAVQGFAATLSLFEQTQRRPPLSPPGPEQSFGREPTAIERFYWLLGVGRLPEPPGFSRAVLRLRDDRFLVLLKGLVTDNFELLFYYFPEPLLLFATARL